jgi:predicted lipoprotein with Yx(FWY)xxD motif
METSLGKVIVGSNGMTVYYFTKDTKDSGKSSCIDECLQKWPPVLVEGEPKIEGITAKVGTINTPEGKKQVTIDGMPVYYWYMDKKPGDVFGQDVGKVWYVVAPDGKMIKDTVPKTSSTPSPSSSPEVKETEQSLY